MTNEGPKEEGGGGVDMGAVYNRDAELFAKADQLETWRHMGAKAMLELLDEYIKNPNAEFLEFGSASARVPGLLVKNGVLPKNITGIEISSDQVEIAKQRIPEATFYAGDITTFDLQEEAYDVVFSHMVFEHLDDQQLLAASRNAYKALKPGGAFAFVVTHPRKMTTLDGNYVEDNVGDGSFDTTSPWGTTIRNYYRTKEKTIQILQEAGFVVELEEDVFFPKETEQTDPQAFEKYRRYVEENRPMRLKLKLASLLYRATQ
jgi:SAM-dependent methyltransferase